MSVEAMAWVWRYGPTEPTERLVLLAIADHADDQGWCYPSMVGIAQKSCVTERGARGVVRRLEAGGWIVVKVGGGRGGKSRYCVLMGRYPEPETGNSNPGKINPEPHSRNTATLNPERGDTKPGTTVPPNHQGTIKEPSTTARERATAVADGVRQDAIPENLSRREQVLDLMGCHPCGITPGGRHTGTTNDMAEPPKWDALGLTRAEQDGVIRDMLAKKRLADPDFMPNRWSWFTAGMSGLVAAKRSSPASAMAQSAHQPDRERRIARLRKLAGS